MKTIAAFIFIIFIGTSAQAQSTFNELKVATVTYEVELNVKIEKCVAKDTNVARLYIYKNSRSKNALKFRTKRNRSKLV